MAFGYSSTNKVAGGAILGGVIGAVQTSLLREYADDSMATAFLKNTSGTPPLLMKQLKGFGSPSALAGIIGGFVGLALGLFALIKGRIIRNAGVASGLAAYGATALTTGIISGALPTTPWSAATAADPNNPIGTPAVQRSISSSALQVARQRAPLTTLGA